MCGSCLCIFFIFMHWFSLNFAQTSVRPPPCNLLKCHTNPLHFRQDTFIAVSVPQIGKEVCPDCIPEPNPSKNKCQLFISCSMELCLERLAYIIRICFINLFSVKISPSCKASVSYSSFCTGNAENLVQSSILISSPGQVYFLMKISAEWFLQ